MSTAAIPPSSGFISGPPRMSAPINQAPMMGTGMATTGVVEPKAFHRQGHYRNLWMRFWQVVLTLTGLALALTALGLDIAGAVLNGKGPNVFNAAGDFVWNSNRYLALWIISAALIPAVLLTGLGALLFSLCAMRHEKNITKFNNDANQYQHTKREATNKLKYLFLIPAFINQLLILGLLGYYLASTIVNAYRLEVARGFTNDDCIRFGVSGGSCNDARRGLRIMLAGNIISMISLLPFLMLNWAACSHLGSHQNKSNVMPPQAATMAQTAPMVRPTSMV